MSTGRNLLGTLGKSAVVPAPVCAPRWTGSCHRGPYLRGDVTEMAVGGDHNLVNFSAVHHVPVISSLSPSSGSVTGGTSILVTGSGFSLGNTATAFRFGTTKAASVSCTSATECIVIAPAHVAGTVEVKAIVGAIASPKTSADRCTYS